MKLNDINRIENFFTDDDIKETKFIIDNRRWSFGSSANGFGTKFWKCNFPPDCDLSKKVLKRLEERYDTKFKINKINVNGQTYGQDSEFHQDDAHEDCYTLLVYISDITPKNFDSIGGCTDIKMTEDSIMSIEPYQKRALLFKSYLTHRGMAPCRKSDILRISLAFKLQVIKNELPFIIKDCS